MPKMKKESRERIIKAYENVSTMFGFSTLNSGLAFFRSELEKTLQKLRSARNRSALEAVLAREQEPSTEQLEAIVKSIELFPYQVRRRLPEATKKTMKKLPHETGGRPQAVSSEEQSKVCEEIGQLFGQGVALKDAQKRVASRRNVSLRTIQRIWQRRKEKKLVPAGTEPADVTKA
jgi:hypothetical protein